MNDHPPTKPDVELAEAREAPYALSGDFLEVCDCYTICPCWTGGSPDESECTGAFAWVIQKGTIDGVDVSGQTAVSISTHEGHRELGGQRVMVFVQETASDEQAAALAALFTGKLGGPLRELAALLGDLLGIERADIAVEFDERRAKLTVGRRIAAEAVTAVGPSGRVMTLSDGRLAEVLGSPAEVGVAQRFKVGLPGKGLDFDLRGRSAMRGRFSYTNRPGK